MPSNYEEIRADNIRRRGEDFAEIGRLLSEQLYSDKTHFIYELLQNAEDALARRIQTGNSEGPRSVSFDLFLDRLEVRHFGQSFNDADVRAICDVLKGTKSQDHAQIGRFGIGFKSVYAFTASPEIHSGDESFKIEQYIRPYPVDRLSLVPGETLFVFPFNHEALGSEAAFSLIAKRLPELGARTLLFLKHISEIKWNILDGESTNQGHYIRDEADDTTARRVTVIGQAREEVFEEDWLVFSRSFIIDGQISAQRLEIAYLLENDEVGLRIQRVENGRLHVYFPTDLETHVGFLLQGPFITTPARDNVVRDEPFNRRLVQESATLVADSLHDLKSQGLLTPTVLSTMPIVPQYFPVDGFFYPLFLKVQQVVRTQEFVPAHGGGHIAAYNARLARTTPLRDLLSPDQLAMLLQESRPLRFVDGEITQNRFPNLYAYLRNLGVKEMDSDAFTPLITSQFMEVQSDEWVCCLYEYLLSVSTLWQKSWQRRPANVRYRPILRLSDDSHVAPYNESDEPQAFLPPDFPIDLPVVKPELLRASAKANEFVVTALRLPKPDIVDQVELRILPKYRNVTAADVETLLGGYKSDVRMILDAVASVANAKRRTFEQLVKSTPWAKAVNARGHESFQCPRDIYYPDDELRSYFSGNESVWFLAADQYEQVELPRIRDLSNTRIKIDHQSLRGYFMPISEFRGRHERGRDGFHPNFDIDGLEEALQRPTLSRSAYIWNQLLIPNFHSIRGTVQRSSTKSFTNLTSYQGLSTAGEILLKYAWLPHTDGRTLRPSDLSVNDLPEAFDRNSQLAEALGMIPPEYRDIESRLGLRQGALTTLRGLKEQDPEQYEQVIKQVDDILQSASTAKKRPLTKSIQPEASESQNLISSTVTINMVEEVSQTFNRPNVRALDDSWIPPSDPKNAERRRERVSDQIAAAQRSEQIPVERFRRIERKLWDAKDNSVKPFLAEQYHGRCQICGFTFAKRNGEYYFEGVYLVSYTKGAWVDRPGNVLCLCANCAAQFEHGAVEAPNFVEEILTTPLPSGSHEARVSISLCGEERSISFTSRHLIDLQALLASGRSDSTSSSGTAYDPSRT